MDEIGDKGTRLEINLDSIINNYNEVRRVVRKDTKILAILKANAYGHGSVKIAETLSEIGCSRFAVSTLEEGIELRKNNVVEDILLLGGIEKEAYEYTNKYNLTPCIYDLESAKYLDELCKKSNKTSKIHIKIDSGMGRIGLDTSKESLGIIEEICGLKNIEVEGIFTHFAKADEDEDFTRLQYRRFMNFIKELEEIGIEIPIKHISNSAGIIEYPEYNLDMVRVGILLYGYYPSDKVNPNIINIRPAMKLKTKLTYVEKSDKGKILGIIPIGYADGYPNLYKYLNQVLIKGKTYNILGKVFMDQCVVDLENSSSLKEGDDVSLIDDENISTSLENFASLTGTIHGEILSRQGRRISRLYYKNNKLISSVCYVV